MYNYIVKSNSNSTDRQFKFWYLFLISRIVIEFCAKKTYANYRYQCRLPMRVLCNLKTPLAIYGPDLDSEYDLP